MVGETTTKKLNLTAAEKFGLFFSLEDSGAYFQYDNGEGLYMPRTVIFQFIFQTLLYLFMKL